MSELNDQTSSIGINWPPVVASNNRLRGFYDSYVETPEDGAAFVECFHEYQGQLEASDEDRLVIRAVVNRSLLPMIETAGVPIEAGFPIRETAEAGLVYAAYNKGDRAVDEAMLEVHGQRLELVVCSDRSTVNGDVVLREAGFTPRIIDHNTPDADRKNAVDRFCDLYATFGYSADEVEELLLNPGNTIAYVENESGVISTGLAEQAQIPVKGFKTLNIAEITEAVTHVDHRGRGYYRAISSFLVTHLLTETDHPFDLIYGESNLAMNAVLMAAHHNGRRFSYSDRQSFNISDRHFGILQQHFHVADGTEMRPYNDFAPSYIPL